MTCRCLIKHAITTIERKAVAKMLDYSRKVGDTFGIILALAAMSGPCAARKETK